jgi:undecaprenyl-diphosphatase
VTVRRERALGAVAVVSLFLLAALAVWARVAAPAPWEPGLLLAADLPPGPAEDAVNAINTLGNLPVWAVLVAIAAVGVTLVRGLAGAAAVAFSFAADLAAFAVKLLVGRDRPETAATDHFFGPDSFSFPSGHVVRTVALLAILAWLFAPAGSRLRLALAAALVGGLVMGFARVSLGVHWPTDALGGTLLGIGWFAVTALLLGRRSLKSVP